MRAMVVRKYGAPEVFEAREVPDPQPKAGEALIRVKAIGAWTQHRGKTFAGRLSEIASVIERLFLAGSIAFS